MHGRFCKQPFAALTIALLASGCTTPHHSNALIFGTNTSVGLDVSQGASGSPGILVGYRRQEAVFMPLVATEKFDENGIPTPCAVTPRMLNGDERHVRILARDGEPVLSPCFLVGRNGGALDTYSVLASFGAQFSARATQPEASGGLAQFFATGLAAQALAIRGGSSLVAVGQAAAVTGTQDTSAEIAALYNAPEVMTGATQIVSISVSDSESLAGFVASHTTADTFSARLGEVEKAAAAPVGTLTMGVCRGEARDACLARLKTPAGQRALGLFNFPWKDAVNTVAGRQ